jgi:glycerol-3-phosphate cytidylyltransferase
MITFTGGTFDLLHAGHIEFLRRCWQISGGAQFQGSLIVSLNTDEFVEEFKGKRPINSYAERLAVLEACRYVSRVVENTGGADSRPAIDAVKPDLVAIGSDWHGRDYLAQMGFTWEWLHERNIALTYIPRVMPVSSTQIRQRLATR